MPPLPSQQRSLLRTASVQNLLPCSGALLGSTKFEFHNLRGFFRSRRELPLSHRVLARLHEQRMSADNARGFDTSIGTDDHFDLHLTGDVHAPSKVRVDRSDPGLYLAARFIRSS